MLNKELLLASNKLDSKNYTHIVTVGQRRLYMEYGYSDPDGYGSIDNDSLRISDVLYTIRMIYQDNENGLGATLKVLGYLDPTTMLYLGRSDTVHGDASRHTDRGFVEFSWFRYNYSRKLGNSRDRYRLLRVIYHRPNQRFSPSYKYKIISTKEAPYA